jgi:hypothetical protein
MREVFIAQRAGRATPIPNQRDQPDCAGYGRGLFFGRELLVPTALAVLAFYSG